MPLPLAALAAYKAYKLYGLYKTGTRAAAIVENYQGLTPRQKARLKALTQRSASGLSPSERAELARLRRKVLARA